MNKTPVSIHAGSINMIILIKHAVSGSYAECASVKHPSACRSRAGAVFYHGLQDYIHDAPIHAPFLTQPCRWRLPLPLLGSGCSAGFGVAEVGGPFLVTWKSARHLCCDRSGSLYELLKSSPPGSFSV